MANMLELVPKLVPRERNDIVFALKRFRYEKYQRLRYNAPITELMFVDRDDVIAALRMWGPAALVEKLVILA